MVFCCSVMLFSQCTISLQKNIKHTDEFWFNEVLCLIIDGRYSTELLEKVKEMAEGIVVEDAPVFKTRDEIIKKQQVCLWTHTHTQHIHTAIMTVFVHGSLCSVTGSMTGPVMLDQHRLDSAFITSDYFFFLNSFTILVFLTLTLP